MQKISWTLEALNDFEDYIGWFLENANESIAANFITTIENVLNNIIDNNYISRMVNEIPELRKYVVQYFPFSVSYWIKDQSEIVITAFLHQKMKK